jgi:hypothetical protein
MQVSKARATLKDIHARILRRRLDALESKMSHESLAYEGPAEGAAASGGGGEGAADRPWDEPDADDKEGKAEAGDDSDNESEAGNFSPELDAGAGGEDVVDEAEDKKAIEAQRHAVLQAEASKFKVASGQGGAAGAADSSVDDQVRLSVAVAHS